MNKIIRLLVVGLIAAVIFSGTAFAAAQIDTAAIQERVDELVTRMQQETIKKNFAALLLQNQMRAKMMSERVPQRFMQSDIQPLVQPAMMEKIRVLMQTQQTEALTMP